MACSPSRYTRCKVLLLVCFLLDSSWIEVFAELINGSTARNLQDTEVVTPQISHRSIGEKELLVVRVEAKNGQSTTATASKLKQDIFTNEITVTTQFASCSRGKFLLKPAGGSSNIDNGVITVKLDSVQGKTPKDVYEQIDELSKDTKLNYFGRKLSEFDQVMICMPKGLRAPQFDNEQKGNSQWIALNPRQLPYKHFLTIYNDSWCSSISSAMHEIGHTLGLYHSGENDNAYDDFSGQMGISYNDKVGARRCFNPAKSWQLGWYSKESRRLDPLLDEMPLSIVLKGITEDVKENEYSVLKIFTGSDWDSDGDIYVGYNHRNSFNSETKEGANMLLINQQKSSGENTSKLLAKLDSNESFRFEHFRDSGKTLVVQMSDRVDDGGGALVNVFFEGGNDEPIKDGCSDKTNQVRFDVSVVTDAFPEETYWTVQNDLTGEIVASRTEFSYFDPSTNYNDWVCLDRDGASYTFSFFDSFQDGLCCKNGFGSYSAFLDGIEVFRGGEFVGMRTVKHSFSVPNSINGETNEDITGIPSEMPIGISSDVSPGAPTMPTNIPTNNPTSVPTGSPTNIPTDKPTEAPTSKPTRRANLLRANLEKSRSGRGACENDRAYLFNDKSKRDCNWIARNESRRKEKCARNDPKTTFSVKFHCPGVCIDECWENNKRRTYKKLLRRRH